MRYIKDSLVLLLQVVVWMSLTAASFGQVAPPKPLTEAQFEAMLNERLSQVNDATDLAEPEKAKAKEYFKQAIAEMQAVKRWVEVTAQNEKLASDAPNETERTKAALAALPPQTAIAIPIDATLLQIEQGISQREAALEKLRKSLADDEEELKGRATRRAKIPEQVGEVKKTLGDINAQLDQPPPKEEKQTLGIARRLLLVAQRRRAEQEIICRQKELEAYEKRTELLPLRHDLEARQIALAVQEIKEWREAANLRRQQEAEQQVQQASLEASQSNSTTVVRRLAEENAELAARRKPLAQSIEEVTRLKEQVDTQLTAVKKLHSDMKEQEAVAGKSRLSSSAGSCLRGQRDTLPNLRDYLRAVEVQQQKQIDDKLASLKLVNDRSAIEQKGQDLLQGLSFAEQDGRRAELEGAIRETLNTQREYLTALIGDYETYLAKLSALIFAENALIGETEECQRFIDERVLWIGSAAPLGLDDIQYGNEAIWWLIGPKAWLDISRTLWGDAVRNPATTVFAVLGFVLLFAWRLRVPSMIQEIGEKAARSNCYRFLPTLETTLLTAVAAVAWPAVMRYVGWRLTVTAGSPDLCVWLGHGLTETSLVFFALECLRRICCPRGLGESHFGWSPAALKVLRANLRWFSTPALLLMCVAVTMAWKENQHWDASLGRVCFMAALLCFAWALHRVLRPGGPLFQSMIVARQGGWLERFRYVWYPLCILTPTALAILAAAGYQYTARQLTVRLILTAYVLVGGIVCRALLLRWTLVNQRKLAIQQAKQRRAAALNELEDASGGDDLPSMAAPERDIAAINTQTRRLIEFSLGVAAVLVIWCAWFDVLPALNTINTELWTTTISVPVKSDVGGQSVLKIEEMPRKVKLADLFLAVIVLATTVIAAKNIPGLLEMAVLQHLPFDAGARYAVATVCRYIITIVGLVGCCGIIGLGWSKVQWLVAAMGLGLGFGLQEIFANFISGLIILFERPVRVGDVITIDTITGVVSKIRMRATTVTDGDRKELIIPNKEFITGRVLNWTLTDPVNRVTINVAVAYGSDTKVAEQILLKVAKEHPMVLDDPPPGVSLEAFGDSSLKFVLRCFLPNLDNRGTVIHDLHMAVDREFRAAGIEMPFPQHDVHVRSIDVPQGILSAGASEPRAAWPSSLPSKPSGRAA